VIRRTLLTAVAVCAVCATTVAAEVPAAGNTSPPRALLRDFVCQRAVDPAQRELSIQAVMRPVTGTEKMALQFVLLSRVRAAGPFRPVSGHYLGNWVTPPNPTLGQQPGDVWIVNHPVLGPAAPATYRFRVTFRWTGADHRVLATVALTSAKCVQPELRPELLVRSLTVTPIARMPNEDVYRARIVNVGGSDAGPFAVEFAPGGTGAIQTAQVAVLAAHTSLTERFVGPACTAAMAPTVIVDPLHQVTDDLDPADNSLTASGPAS
jgi:hypothetical protein